MHHPDIVYLIAVLKQVGDHLLHPVPGRTDQLQRIFSTKAVEKGVFATSEQVVCHHRKPVWSAEVKLSRLNFQLFGFNFGEVEISLSNFQYNDEVIPECRAGAGHPRTHMDCNQLQVTDDTGTAALARPADRGRNMVSTGWPVLPPVLPHPVTKLPVARALISPAHKSPLPLVDSGNAQN